MATFLQRIIFVLASLILCNYTSASVMIYINTSHNNCSQSNMNNTCVDEFGYSNFTSYICPNLESALDYVTSNGNFSFVHICLPSGLFALTKPWSLSGISVALTGYREDNLKQSIVQCDYDVEQDGEIAFTVDQLNHTLLFCNAEFVKFEFVHFSNCPQPVRIEQSDNVSIANCMFTNFSEAVFDIYNSALVELTNSTFSNNSGTGSVLLPYRGNTGAVSIGYNQYTSVTNPFVLVDNCLFTNNRANVFTKSFITSSNLVSRGTYTGRGGGLGVFINESYHNVTAVVINSQFIDNFAISFGGGFYIAFDGEDSTQHMITVNNCRFERNIGLLGGGGVNIGYLANGNRNFPLTARIQNCYFLGNQGETGGAMYIFPASTFGGDGNVAYIENSTYEDNEATNFGGAIAAALYSLFRDREVLPLYRISNCTFKRNRCPDGILNIAYIPFTLNGRNMFVSNQGPALRIIGSVVQIHDVVSFIENESQDGGALYINSFGQLDVFPNTIMVFERNRGQIGASIVVATERISSVFTQLINNPACFLLYSTHGLPFLDISDLNFTFTDNSALEASAVSLLSTQQCSWIGNQPPYFDSASILKWPFLHISNTTNNLNEMSLRNTSHIETAVTRITFPNNTISGWPGQKILLPIELIDETNQSASGFLRLQPVDNSDQPTTRYRIQPTLLYQQSNQLEITFAVENNVQADISNNIASTKVNVRELLVGNVANQFTVNVTPCLAGYDLTDNSELGGLTCQCHADLEYIRNCEDESQSTILLTDGQWGLEQRYTGEHVNLLAYPCPPGYCRCIQDHSSLGDDVCSFAYFNGEPDRQCNCDRQGYLCGDCRDGKGISALLNRCVDCSDVNSILIAVLIILDAVFIIFLLCKDVKFSALLFPTIFFVNMVSYVGENFPTSYDHVGKYIYFINSLISLYFPYDFCLYSGTTVTAAYTFRYFPVLLTVIICSIGLTWLRYSFKTIKAFAWYSLWLLLTLQYSHVVYTSMTILHCPRLVNEIGEKESRWFVQGSLQCFTGRHILLGLCAILMLLLCALLIPFLGLVAVGRVKKPHWMAQLADCLKYSFKDDLPWWCMIELGRKFIFLLFLIPFPQNTCPPMLVLMTIFALYAYMLPYKDIFVNILELFFQLSFILFLLLRSTKTVIDDYLLFPHNEQQHKDLVKSDSCSNETRIATLTWILFPFAYVPLVIIIIILFVKIMLKLWRCKPFRKHSRNRKMMAERGSLRRASTLHVNVSKARHLTFDFVNNAFVNVTRRKSTVKSVDNSIATTEDQPTEISAM